MSKYALGYGGPLLREMSKVDLAQQERDEALGRLEQARFDLGVAESRFIRADEHLNALLVIEAKEN